MFDAAINVFSRPRYSIMAVLVALISFSATLLFANLSLLTTVVSSGTVRLSDKLAFVVSLYGTLGTNYTVWSSAYLIIVSVLFGINVSLVVYYIRRRQSGVNNKRLHATNVGGVIAALFGLGCMACGSVVLTALFGITGSGLIIASLPLHGIEFGVIGLLLLVGSIVYILKHINDPLVCAID